MKPASEAPVLTWDVPRAPGAFARARDLVRATLRRWGCDTEGVDVVVLLVTEMVTNAHRHADSDACLRLRPSGHGVEVAVADASPLPPVRRTPDVTSGTGGLGLQILERLASRWGVEPHGPGKRVWADVPCHTGLASAAVAPAG
ncbi:ATP-binding protein [Streptomyces sp. JJ66]|uniref:ATP-binding protein n=1 Tax=Streptomyces sp. JJ66 TaxID=2803843 RepID=UPI001C5602E4|nr:ATP-binding protein [Streptomyces sp. JJ66]MBW1603724.1 ATP-binding protein [Streptomyces sp. JJ66]